MSRQLDFEQYSRQVYGWAYRLLGRHHDALDVVQDVFLRWDEQCGSRVPDRPRGWLRRVTVNRAIDVCRKRQSDTPTAGGTPAVHELPVGLTAGDRAALRTDITAALDELTDVQREVLVAKVYEDLTFAQIAADLDVAISTVKTHYLRAVRALRDRLRPKWADEENP